MKLPLSWLREWVEVNADAGAIADGLTKRGFYVEGIETHGRHYPGVVVARVLDVAKHPNADKLSLCRVDGGAGELRVVCGAPNVRAGMMAPLATVGARLPGGVVIRKSKIRGEESQGMLCSARELELSDDAGGIVDLVELVGDGDGLVVGRPLDDLLPEPETILEVEIPFNRPDGLGIVGLAREVKAALGGGWTAVARERLAARWAGDGGFDVAIEDAEGCRHYVAQAVEGVTIGPSPRWLVQRLESVGQRSINQVVDLTNLVLFELGQPVHAFDLDRLKGPAIRVRRARAGESLTTLDGKPRALSPEVLLIADAGGPVALAGIMGGAASEVSETTTRLLLEAAWFDPRRTRRGSRALGLSTEASKRFERGVDPELAPLAAARFVALLREIAPGTKPGAGGDARAPREAWSAGPARTPLTLRVPQIRRLTGLDLDAAEAKRQLEAMDFAVGSGAKHELSVTVPSWRPDVTLEADLVEEVARGYGYDAIPEAPLETRGAHAARSTREVATTRARRAMLARGLSEAWTSTLVSETEAATCAALLGDQPASLVRLANPMSRESEVLRPNPLPGLLRAVAHNLRQGAPAVRLFEIGAGFRGGASSDPLPEERSWLVGVLVGPRYAHAHDAAQQATDFGDAKGLWEAWLEEMRVDTPEWRSYSGPGWKPGASAEVASRTSRIGWAGALAKPLLRSWDIEVPADVFAFAVLLDSILPPADAETRVTLPSRYPPVRRDLAFFVPRSVTHDQVERTVREAGGDRLVRIELFDVYDGTGTPEGMKSLAFAVQFEHPERTLAESEIQAVQERIVAAVGRACGGRLREK